MNEGILYIIATPIGNLNDISLRAIEILKNVDLVLSEDTRETSKLFKHFEINSPQISYRDQNHNRVIAEIIQMLESGKKLALVSDSGTPVISDPGFKLINDVIDKNLKVVSIPGPSSITSALSIAGVPTDKFCFLGFLPKTRGAQTSIIENYGKLDCTLVIFESPYRIIKLLQTIKEVLGDRYCAITAELTKTFERVHRGEISKVLDILTKHGTKGEFVVMIAKQGYRQ